MNLNHQALTFISIVSFHVIEEVNVERRAFPGPQKLHHVETPFKSFQRW